MEIPTKFLLAPLGGAIFSFIDNPLILTDFMGIPLEEVKILCAKGLLGGVCGFALELTFKVSKFIYNHSKDKYQKWRNKGG